ncbi:hypothetical protein N7450_007522 [Penicillium hetheringtonii]|uniref:Gcp-like domain-containing protein n=1 Tax=Penicillium hetheringtonii TaxID=911720 RepID=A0AAD6DHV0_9EURO|nr:hypothetical protein N7450_007522 [Penicillium hetheringtonii]
MFSILASARTLRLSSASTRTNLNTLRCHRGLLTLAIETSCDDTSVAIVEKENISSTSSKSTIHFLENITADSRAHRGIHPILALESHQASLANLVNKALSSLPAPKNEGERGSTSIINLADGSLHRRPDFISATRGPGMRSNLSVGLDTGKALSVAWQIPLIGVHHMQAHLLTPRLVSKGREKKQETTSTRNSHSDTNTPSFPFLSILVSGGHSILVHSKSLVDHKIMASSEDIAIGEALDKSAREILPPELLQNAKNTMYGKTLEDFVFPNGAVDFAGYRPPQNRGRNPYGWSVTTPFANTRALQLSFSSIASMVNKIVKGRESISSDERVELGREAMRVCFEHLASRTIIALEALRRTSMDEEETKTVVVSGGVAANKFLMAVLRSFLDVRGFEDVEIVAPPPNLCTDNAAMIGWAGIEMFEAGWKTDLSCRALRKWTLDPEAEDGGVLGPVGWVHADAVSKH